MTLEDLAAQGPNLALHLDERALSKITSDCLEGYERDKASRSEWEADFDNAMKAIRGEKQPKNFPFDGCANFSYPLITTACMQFNANAYPAVVNGEQVVKGLVTGPDPDGAKQARADRVSEHMSFQLLEEMPEWERETDALLLHLPAAGMAFRQYTWDAGYERPRSEFISAKHLVVNQNCRDLESVPLITKEFERYPYQISEAMADGLYRREDISWEGEGEAQQSVQCMLECHFRADLDEDGYPEPYVGVIHKESQKLLSIKPGFWPEDVRRNEAGEVVSVRRRSWFVPYEFIPDPEGGFYGVGFGRLLRSHSDIIDTILNQLIDAATLQNAGGGFIGNGVRLDGGNLTIEPGEWKMLPVSGQALAQNLIPLPAPGPSASLFQLLGLIVESGKDIAQIKDVLTGETNPTVQPTTLMALIEQGMKVFNAIYKRCYRGLKAEFNIVFDLNSAYLPEEAYFRVSDDPKAVKRADYNRKDLDVRPVSDPAVVTGPQKLAKAQFLAGYQDDPAMDGVAIRKRIFEAAQIPDSAALFKKEGEPDPQMRMAQEAAAGELAKQKAENDNKDADTKKKLAEAEQVALENEELRRRLAEQDMTYGHAQAALEADLAGELGGVGDPPGDEAGLAGPEGPVGVDPAGVDPGLLGAGDGIDAGPVGTLVPEGQGPDGGGIVGLEPDGGPASGVGGPEQPLNPAEILEEPVQ